MKGLTLKQFLNWQPIQQLVQEGVITKEVIEDLATKVTRQNPPSNISFDEFSQLGDEMENFLFGRDDYSEAQMTEDFGKVLQQKASMDEIITNRMMEKKAKYNLTADIPPPLTFVQQIDELDRQIELQKQSKHPSEGIDDDEVNGNDEGLVLKKKSTKKKSVPRSFPTQKPTLAPTPTIAADVAELPCNMLSDAEYSEIYQDMLDKVNHS